MACINCKTNFEGQFCPSCGEKKDIERITFGSMIESVFSGFVNMDKGLLFNIKNLTLYPQKTILQYIKGKRKYILSPISYAIVTISVYIIITSLLKKAPSELKVGLGKLGEQGELGRFQQMGYKTGGFLIEKLKYFWLLQAVFLSVFSKLFFKRFNFFEHLAINSFIVGHATLVAIIVRIFYRGEIIVFNFLVFIYMIFLMYKVFGKTNNKFETITMSSLIVLFAYILFMGLPFTIANYIS
ncbi:hypothetical protein LPB136_01125 [Tenacibaculum todarodis]|uniref:DUF3667 domain-containing protein n=1 Tax=Tenacibaculum todarodis TaxID=1850252 RepID=A0A1L3JG54_9FLAO|nr:DUF3667 domain-containing protein [Tenacibaculum todarodis]APG64053.1 hypothetical protein LPB136_01125 [Tenacibaculum todarodis]